MARNGSGTYSKVNTFVAGNTITAAGHNENWDDLVTEMSNSVAADGQTSLTGALKGANGTVSLPAYSFASDTDSGTYRIGANNLGIAVNGAKVLDVGTAGLGITGTLSATSDVAINTNKFTVTASSGNTVVAGTLGVTGDVAVNTNKFNVTASSGNTAIAGTLGVTGDVAVNTNKFTVAASSGNTVVAGTLNVTGVATLSGGVAGLIAAQSDQETATSTTLAVSPGRQQFHPSAAKVWTEILSDATNAVNYNVSSVTDGGAGTFTPNWGTDFSSSQYALSTGILNTPAGTAVSTFTAQFNSTLNAGTATVLTIRMSDFSAQDTSAIMVTGFGDQA